MVERRNFQRVPFATEAEINCNEKKYYGELLDISLQGALIQGKGTIPFEKGDICELSIHLSGTSATRIEESFQHRRLRLQLNHPALLIVTPALLFVP